MYKKVKNIICLSFVILLIGVGISFAEVVEIQSQIAEVIFLQGNDYEMGYQYGQQRADNLSKRTTPLTLDEYRAVMAYQYYIKLRTPEMIEQLIGMADGLTDATDEKWSYLDCLVNLTGSTIYDNFPQGAEDDAFPPREDSCSAWAATGTATVDGKTIACGSRDGDRTNNRETFLTVVFPTTGNNYIVNGWPGINGMNNRGVSLMMGGADKKVPYGYGLPDNIEHAHLLRFCDTAADVVEKFTTDWLPIASHGTNRLVADTNGDLYVVEICHDKAAVREAGDFGEEDFIYNANIWMIEDMALHTENNWEENEFIEHGGWIGSYDSGVARNLEMWDMLHNYKSNIDLEFAMMTWQYPGNPPDGTGEGISKIKPINKLRYWGKIGNQDNGSVVITRPDDGNRGEWYYCDGTPGWLTYPLGGDRGFVMGSTHSFFKLILSSSPFEVATSARDITHKTWTNAIDGSCLSKAYYELMKLNYHDTAFVPLKDLFNIAHWEYQKGNDWLDAATQSIGNQNLYCYSKAATWFCRAQAHANQVYRALVPPATRPEDLGLEQFGGDWGEWAQPEWEFGLKTN